MIVDRKIKSRLKIFTANTTIDVEFQHDLFVDEIMSKGATIKEKTYQMVYDSDRKTIKHSLAIHYEIPNTAETDIKK